MLWFSQAKLKPTKKVKINIFLSELQHLWEITASFNSLYWKHGWMVTSKFREIRFQEQKVPGQK